MGHACSLLGGWVDLLTRSEVWSLLSLVLWIDLLNSLLVLCSLLGAANNELSGSLLLIDLWRLPSDLTVTGQVAEIGRAHV